MKDLEMANRKPSNPKGAETWEGKRVRFHGHSGGPSKEGVVMRMATGKEICMYVAWDLDPLYPTLSYARDLEIIS